MHEKNKNASEGQIKKHWSRYELEVDSDTFGGRLYKKDCRKVRLSLLLRTGDWSRKRNNKILLLK